MTTTATTTATTHEDHSALNVHDNIPIQNLGMRCELVV